MDLMEHGDPGIAWSEADAANDDGEAVMRAEQEAGEAALDARIAELVHEWPRRIRTALNAVMGAQSILNELRECDGEMFDTAAGAEARNVLVEAHVKLNRAAAIAADRLKLVEDAEMRAELEQLRAENARLRASLAPGGAV